MTQTNTRMDELLDMGEEAQQKVDLYTDGEIRIGTLVAWVRAQGDAAPIYSALVHRLLVKYAPNGDATSFLVTYLAHLNAFSS